MTENWTRAYQVNAVTGARRAIILRPGPLSPPDELWLETGVWSKPHPNPPPIGGSPVRPPPGPENDLERLMALAPYLGGPVSAEDLAWLRRALRAQLPVGHCGESSAELIERQRAEERFARVMSAMMFHVLPKGT